MSLKWLTPPLVEPTFSRGKFGVVSASNMAGVLFEDIFNVKDIDPEGKKFDRGESISRFILRRIRASSWRRAHHFHCQNDSISRELVDLGEGAGINESTWHTTNENTIVRQFSIPNRRDKLFFGRRGLNRNIPALCQSIRSTIDTSEPASGSCYLNTEIIRKASENKRASNEIIDSRGKMTICNFISLIWKSLKYNMYCIVVNLTSLNLTCN